METIKCLKARFAICVDNSEYPVALDLHKLYRVVPDEGAKKDGDLRISDESGEDYLFHNSHFVFLELPLEVEQALVTA